MRNFLVGVVFLSLAGVVPAAARVPPTILGWLAGPGLAGLPAFQVGIASWYGADFQGRETSSGERFNMYGLTAANRSLPMGAVVRVTNLANARSLVLRINDRGPVPRSRLLDVSFEAARRLDFVNAGLTPVRIDLLSLPALP